VGVVLREAALQHETGVDVRVERRTDRAAVVEPEQVPEPLNSTSASWIRPLEKNHTGVIATVDEPNGKKPEALLSSNKIRWIPVEVQSVRAWLASLVSSTSVAVVPVTAFQSWIAMRSAVSWLPSGMSSEPAELMTIPTAAGLFQRSGFPLDGCTRRT
jgi:hypothetical protein